jgi:hypothetical protein
LPQAEGGSTYVVYYPAKNIFSLKEYKNLLSAGPDVLKSSGTTLKNDALPSSILLFC